MIKENCVSRKKTERKKKGFDLMKLKKHFFPLTKEDL